MIDQLERMAADDVGKGTAQFNFVSSHTTKPRGACIDHGVWHHRNNSADRLAQGDPKWPLAVNDRNLVWSDCKRIIILHNSAVASKLQTDQVIVLGRQPYVLPAANDLMAGRFVDGKSQRAKCPSCNLRSELLRWRLRRDIDDRSGNDLAPKR